MLDIEDNGITFLVTDDNYEFNKKEILRELLENLDYKMELDFCIKITTEKLFGFQGDFTPKEEVNILNALEDLEKVFDEVKEMDKEESKIHFEVLLLK